MTFAAKETTEIKRLRDEIRRGTRVVCLGGLTSVASKAFVLSQLQAATGKTFVVVADSNKDLETWECDLAFWSGELGVESREKKSNSQLSTLNSQLLTLPSFETDVYSGISPHAETLERRALTLWNLTFARADFLIVSAKSLITKTVAPAEMKSLGAILKRDADFAPEDLIEKLVAGGYVREEPLKSIGEFSVRGGILDVWSPTAALPVRIEFFGDTVDSIREFDAETQLSVGQLKEIAIAPMREFAAGSGDFNDWTFFARERFADEKHARAVKDRTDFAAEGESFSGWEFLIPLVNPRESSVFEYLKDAVFVIDEPPLIEQTLASYYETLQNRFAEISNAGEIGLEPDELFLSGTELREKLGDKQRLELRLLGKSAAQTGEDLEFENDLSEPPAVAGGLNSKKTQKFTHPLPPMVLTERFTHPLPQAVLTKNALRYFCFQPLKSMRKLRSVRARRANFTAISQRLSRIPNLGSQVSDLFFNRTD